MEQYYQQEHYDMRSQTLNAHHRIKNKLNNNKKRISTSRPNLNVSNASSNDDGGFDDWQWGASRLEPPKSAPLPRKLYHHNNNNNSNNNSSSSNIRERTSPGPESEDCFQRATPTTHHHQPEI